MPRAAIDLGSNSALLVVVADDGRVLHDEARVVGLGRGLGDRGLLQPERMAAAEAALADFVAVARRHGVEPYAIRGVATSACRRAMNAETWLARVKRTLGLQLRIIPGDEEARLTWLGSTVDLQLPPGPCLTIDLGGGSTELVLGEGPEVFSRISLELGSVRLTEAFLGDPHRAYDATGLARLRRAVDAELTRFDFNPAPRAVIGVAGTVTTLATMALGLKRYDPLKVHGSVIARSDLARFIDQLLPAGPAERRALAPASPERADYLLAGAAVLDRVLGAARRPAMTVSDRGLRFGVLQAP